MAYSICLLIRFCRGLLHGRRLEKVVHHLEECQDTLAVLGWLIENRERVMAGCFLKGA